MNIPSSVSAIELLNNDDLHQQVQTGAVDATWRRGHRPYSVQRIEQLENGSLLAHFVHFDVINPITKSRFICDIPPVHIRHSARLGLKAKVPSP